MTLSLPLDHGQDGQHTEWETLYHRLESVKGELGLSVDPNTDEWSDVSSHRTEAVSDRDALLDRVEELTRTLQIATEALAQSNANCRRLHSIIEDISGGLAMVASSFWARPIRSTLMQVVSRAGVS